MTLVVAPRRTERAGTERTVATRTFAMVYHGSDIWFGPGPRFAFRHRTIRHGNVDLMTSAVSSEWSGRFVAGSRTIMAWTTTGGLRVDDRLPAMPGTPVMLPTDRPFTVAAAAGTVHLLDIDTRFLGAVHGVVSGGAFTTPAFRPEPDAAVLPRLLAGIEAVASNAFHPSEDGSDHFAAQVLLAGSVLQAFLDPATDHHPGPTNVGLSVVRQAQAWIAAHCHQQIRLAEVCAEVGVSPRSLQDNFLRYVGMTPISFLRTVRLDRVHVALQLADPRVTTVADIAYQWGFRHMGRFAAVYRQQFDEYPGATLREADGTRGGDLEAAHPPYTTLTSRRPPSSLQPERTDA